MQHLAQVAPRINGHLFLHAKVAPPFKVVGVQSAVLTQFDQIIGQLFGRFVVQDVDVRMGRGETRVMSSAQNDGHRLRQESSEQLLGDVIRTKVVLERQVEQVISFELLVARIARVLVAVAGQVAAPAVDVDADVFLQLGNVELASDVRLAVRDEPGGRDALAADVHSVKVVQRLLLLVVARPGGSFQAVGNQSVQSVAESDDVRVPAVRVRPVVEVRPDAVVDGADGKDFRLVVVLDEPLVGEPVGGQVGGVPVLDLRLEHDGSAAVEQTAVIRQLTVRNRTRAELVRAVTKVKTVAQTVPRGPQKDRLHLRGGC